MDGHRYTAGFEAPGGKPILHAYPDPITRGSPWTIGLGHTGHDVHQGDTWTEDRCWNAFYSDYASAQANASHIIGNVCWESLSEPRRAVLTDMCFNIGFSRLMGFRQMLAAIKAGEWQAAHDELLDSEYALQVKTRASKNAKVMLTGDWPHELV
jgi:lysozyme